MRWKPLTFIHMQLISIWLQKETRRLIPSQIVKALTESWEAFLNPCRDYTPGGTNQSWYTVERPRFALSSPSEAAGLKKVVKHKWIWEKILLRGVSRFTNFLKLRNFRNMCSKNRLFQLMSKREPSFCCRWTPSLGSAAWGGVIPFPFTPARGLFLEKMNGAMFKADRKVRAGEGEHEMTVCATCGVHQTMHANRLEQKFVIDRIRWTTSQRPYEPSRNVMSRLWIFRLGHTVKHFMFDWRLRAHTKAAHETKVFQPRQSGFASHLTRAGTHLLLVYTERSAGCYHIGRTLRDGTFGQRDRATAVALFPHCLQPSLPLSVTPAWMLSKWNKEGQERLSNKLRFVWWSPQFKRTQLSK